MADKKISQLTSMSSASASADLIPIVRTSSNETRKITPAKLPMSDSALVRATPYTTDFVSGTERTRDLTAIDASSGFYGSSGLTSVHIGSNVTSMGSYSFSGNSNLTQLKIPGTCTVLDASAVNNNSNLTSVVLDEGITTISSNGIYNCAITSLNIPDSVTSVGAYAFAKNPLVSVVIGSGMPATNINGKLFNTLGNTLTSITVSADNPNIKSIDNAIYTKDGTQFLTVADGVSSVSIPSGVTTIAVKAFLGTSATTITIPSTLTTIGANAFQSCQATSLAMPDSVTSVGSFAFAYSAITSYPFSATSSLTSIPSLGFFNCLGLTSVSVHNGLTSIGNYSFTSCSNLTTVTLPSTTTSIGNTVFSNCTNLSTFNILATTAPTLSGGSFGSNTPSLTEIHVPVGATGYGATYGGKTVVYDL